MPKVKDIIKRLQDYHKPDDIVATSIWNPDDVIDRAKDTEEPIPTQEEAEQIIENIDHQHDANIGINWEVIDCHLFDLNYDKEKKNA